MHDELGDGDDDESAAPRKPETAAEPSFDDWDVIPATDDEEEEEEGCGGLPSFNLFPAAVSAPLQSPALPPDALDDDEQGGDLGNLPSFNLLPAALPPLRAHPAPPVLADVHPAAAADIHNTATANITAHSVLRGGPPLLPMMQPTAVHPAAADAVVVRPKYTCSLSPYADDDDDSALQPSPGPSFDLIPIADPGQPAAAAAARAILPAVQSPAALDAADGGWEEEEGEEEEDAVGDIQASGFPSFELLLPMAPQQVQPAAAANTRPLASSKTAARSWGDPAPHTPAGQPEEVVLPLLQGLATGAGRAPAEEPMEEGDGWRLEGLVDAGCGMQDEDGDDWQQQQYDDDDDEADEESEDPCRPTFDLMGSGIGGSQRERSGGSGASPCGQMAVAALGAPPGNQRQQTVQERSGSHQQQEQRQGHGRGDDAGMEWEEEEEEEEEEDPCQPSLGMPSFNLLPPARPRAAGPPPVSRGSLGSAQQQHQCHANMHYKAATVAVLSPLYPAPIIPSPLYPAIVVVPSPLYPAGSSHPTWCGASGGIQLQGGILRDVSNQRRFAFSPAAAPSSSSAANRSCGAAAGVELKFPGSCVAAKGAAEAAHGKVDAARGRQPLLLPPLPQIQTSLTPRPAPASAIAGYKGGFGGGGSDDDISIVRVIRPDLEALPPPSLGISGQHQHQQLSTRCGTAAFPMAIVDDDDVPVAAPLGSIDVIEEAGDSREGIEDADEEQDWNWKQQKQQEEPWEREEQQEEPWEQQQPASGRALEGSIGRGALHPAAGLGLLGVDEPRRFIRSLPVTPQVTVAHVSGGGEPGSWQREMLHDSGGGSGEPGSWQREMLLGASGKQRAIILPPPPLPPPSAKARDASGFGAAASTATGPSPPSSTVHQQQQRLIEGGDPLRNGSAAPASASAAAASRRASLSRHFQAEQMKHLGLADDASAAARMGSPFVTAANGGVAGGNAGAKPWWSLLPDFVPVGALAGGVDPRSGLRVHVLYDQQFTTNSAAAHQAAAAAAVHGRGGSSLELAAAAASDILSAGGGAGGGSANKRRGGGGAGGAAKKSRRPAGQQRFGGGGGGEGGGAAAGGGGQWYFRDGTKVYKDRNGNEFVGKAAWAAYKGTGGDSAAGAAAGGRGSGGQKRKKKGKGKRKGRGKK